MKPIKNPDKPTKSEEKNHFNARAKNCLFESFSMDVFNQVFTLNTAHDIWLKLQELHDGRPHGLCLQGWSSPREGALRGTILLGASRKAWEGYPEDVT